MTFVFLTNQVGVPERTTSRLARARRLFRITAQSARTQIRVARILVRVRTCHGIDVLSYSFGLVTATEPPQECSISTFYHVQKPHSGRAIFRSKEILLERAKLRWIDYKSAYARPLKDFGAIDKTLSRVCRGRPPCICATLKGLWCDRQDIESRLQRAATMRLETTIGCTMATRRPVRVWILLLLLFSACRVSTFVVAFTSSRTTATLGASHSVSCFSSGCCSKQHLSFGVVSTAFWQRPTPLPSQCHSSNKQRTTAPLFGMHQGMTDDDDHPPAVVNATMRYVHPDTTVAHIGRNAAGDDQQATHNDNNNTTDDIQWMDVFVRIHDMRHSTNSDIPTLHRHGVELRSSPLQDDDSLIDFLDRRDVVDRYYPHCEALVRSILLESDHHSHRDSMLVRAFDHNVRWKSTNDTVPVPHLKNSGPSKVQPALQLVHGDYTVVSAPKRLHDLSQPPKLNDVWRNDKNNHNGPEQDGEEQSEGLFSPELVRQVLNGETDDKDQQQRRRRRFAIVNVWRSLDREAPVQAFPLACVDARTVSPTTDLRTLQIHYADRIGENYLGTLPRQIKDKEPRNSGNETNDAKQNDPQPTNQEDGHVWMYWSHMVHDEVLIIKQWDSHGTDVAQLETSQTSNDDTTDDTEQQQDYISTFSLHSAFELPKNDDKSTTIPSVERKSIEVRCMVIY